MFRSVPVRNLRYEVEIGAGAWPQVGRVPTPAFERIRTELLRRGELASLEGQMGMADMPRQAGDHVLIVDAYTVTYAVDDAQRVVILLGIEKRQQDEG